MNGQKSLKNKQIFEFVIGTIKELSWCFPCTWMTHSAKISAFSKCFRWSWLSISMFHAVLSMNSFFELLRIACVSKELAALYDAIHWFPTYQSFLPKEFIFIYVHGSFFYSGKADFIRNSATWTRVSVPCTENRDKAANWAPYYEGELF